YARNEKYQLFGSDDRQTRALTENETLDQFGNIVNSNGGLQQSGAGTGSNPGNNVKEEDFTGAGTPGAGSQGEELSYFEQYMKDHPDARVDKYGWVQNADGSYARNEKYQLFGSDDRQTRDLTENETLDQFGNIVNRPDTASAPSSLNQQTTTTPQGTSGTETSNTGNTQIPGIIDNLSRW
ncbi:MAG: hypothetical protein MJ060_04275, partial [Clostridia bacterium]|nr:hypothetical protein [Clostridia bacterium]